MRMLISGGISVALATFFLLFGCATLGTTVADILKTCAVPAAEAEAAQLYQTVLAVVDKQPVNWEAQLEVLEKNFKTGVLCALQQIANGQPGPTTTVKLSSMPNGAAQMLFAVPSAKASANAKAFLTTH